MKNSMLYLMLTLGLTPCVLNAASASKTPEKSLEIEVKFQLNAPSYGIFEQWLITNATLKGSEQLQETYFDNPKRSFYFVCARGYLEALDTLRIRRSDKKKPKACRKKTVVTDGGKEVKEETEWAVKDYTSEAEGFRSTGYTDTVHVTKTPRTSYEYTNAAGISFEIVIDNVSAGKEEGKLAPLGTFVEIELKSEISNADAGLNLIWGLLKEIGIKELTQINRSYIHMLSNPDWEKHPEWGFFKAIEIK